jgi:hypothetical protein
MAGVYDGRSDEPGQYGRIVLALTGADALGQTVSETDYGLPGGAKIANPAVTLAAARRKKESNQQKQSPQGCTFLLQRGFSLHHEVPSGTEAQPKDSFHHEGTKVTKEDSSRKRARVVISTEGRNLSQIPRSRSG